MKKIITVIACFILTAGFTNKGLGQYSHHTTYCGTDSLTISWGTYPINNCQDTIDVYFNWNYHNITDSAVSVQWIYNGNSFTPTVAHNGPSFTWWTSGVYGFSTSTAGGTYYFQINTPAGCADTLTFNYSSCESTTYDTICQGDSVFFDNHYITQAGTYMHLGDTLHLSVNPAPQISYTAQYGSLCNGVDSLIAYISGATEIQWSLNGSTVLAYTTTTSSTVTEYNANAPGNYLLTITNSFGCTNTASFSVSPCIVGCGSITLQPNGTTGKDAHIDNLNPNTPDNNYPVINAGYNTVGGTPTLSHNLLQFDLSAVPTGANVISATLSLTHSSSSSHSSNATNHELLAKVTQPWAENTVTWNTQPTYSSSDIVHIGNANIGEDKPNIDITSFVQDWISNPASNYGMLMRLVNEPGTLGRFQSYASSDDPNPASRPKLTIIWNNCDSGTVWPGDADHNGICDNYDLLPIGIAHGSGGPARATTSIVWQGWQCADWGLQLLNGTNAKHIDCDGNGAINVADAQAVVQNFSLVHNKTEEERKPSREDIPELYVVFQDDTLNNGDTLVASIQLGSLGQPANNVYGLAFTYNFDATVLDTSSITFEYTNSWLAIDTEKVSLAKGANSSGIIKTAITRFDHVNRSGSGEIAIFRAIITTDNINGKTNETTGFYTTSHFISGLRAIDKDQNEVELNEGIDSAKIGYKASGVQDTQINDADWLLFPNPTNKVITVKGTENIEGVVIHNVLGEEIYAVSNSSNRQEETVDVSSLPNGVYIAQITTANGTGSKRFIIAR